VVKHLVPNQEIVGSIPTGRSKRCHMDDSKKVVLLESTLREILRINEEAGKNAAYGSIPLECALDGTLLYRWIDIREKAKGLLKGEAR
jgi:hypothetical protein